MTVTVFKFDIRPSKSHPEYGTMKGATAYVYIREDVDEEEAELTARAILVEAHFEVAALVGKECQMTEGQCNSPTTLEYYRIAIRDGYSAIVVAKGVENMGGDASFN